MTDVAIENAWTEFSYRYGVLTSEAICITDGEQIGRPKYLLDMLSESLLSDLYLLLDQAVATVLSDEDLAQNLTLIKRLRWLNQNGQLIEGSRLCGLATVRDRSDRTAVSPDIVAWVFEAIMRQLEAWGLISPLPELSFRVYSAPSFQATGTPGPATIQTSFSSDGKMVRLYGWSD